MAESKSFLSRLVSELKRRKVPRVAAAYLAVAAAAIGAVTAAVATLNLPDRVAALFVLGAILGFPVAIVVSWVFDFTPEGVKRTEEEAEERLVLGRFARMALLGVTLVATLVVGVVFWNVQVTGKAAVATGAPAAAPLDPNHVAVLDLKDISPDDTLGWLADGLTVTLRDRLGAVDALTVIPANGVKPFRDVSLPFDSIGKLLHAGSVIEGSVQGSGNRVRVNIQLVDASTGTQVTSGTFEGSQGDPFALQDSVSQKAARFLRKRLGRSIEIRRQKRAADDPHAWELYQRGIEYRNDAADLSAVRDTAGAMQRYQKADSLFDAAAALDARWTEPTLESGWTHLAMSRVQAALPRQADPALLRKGLQDANRVLARDSGNAPALELRGTLRWFLSETSSDPQKKRLLDEAEADLRDATSTDPGLARAWALLAYILRDQGKFEEAGVDANRMKLADPYLANDAQYLYVSAMLALELHHIERADSLFARGEALYPDAPTFVANRLVIVASRPYRPGAVDTAWARFRRARAIIPSAHLYQEGPFMVAATLARAGLGDSARAVARRVWGLDSTTTTAEKDGAYVALQLGERQRALDLLGRYLEQAPEKRPYVARDWWWDKLHEDPRFQAMVDTTRTPAR